MDENLSTQTDSASRNISTEPRSREPIVSDHKRSKKPLLVAVLIVVLVLVAVGGTYYWQHKKVSSLNTQLTSLQKQLAASGASTNLNAEAVSQQGSYVSDIGVGYPLSLAHKEVLTTLVLPSGYNMLQTDINTKTQDELAAQYVESYNDIIAHWQFNRISTLKQPSQSLQSNDSVTISALNDWANTDDPDSVTYESMEPAGSPAMTVAQKADFVNTLKHSTAACAQDSSKGFTTIDKVYNVCYTMLHPQAQGADWIMSLSGYASLNGTDVYLRGTIDLPNSYQTEQSRFLSAFKQLKTVVQSNPNNP